MFLSAAALTYAVYIKAAAFYLMVDVNVGQRRIELDLVMEWVCACCVHIFNNIDYILIQIDIVLFILICACFASYYQFTCRIIG